MKGFIGAALLCLAPIATAAASAQTISAAAPGAVELRLSAAGQSVNRADYVTIYVPISTTGETASAARAANGAAIAAVTNALVSHGIDRAAITLVPATTGFGFVGNEAYGPDAPQALPQLAAMMARKTAFSTLQIRLTDPALVGRVRDALDEQNQGMSGAPIYALKDERAAKDAAIADALAKARRDAEAYAAPLGLRVDRMTSVSNYGDTTLRASIFARMMADVQEDTPNNVTTRADIWVDFVLVPR